MEDEKEFSFEEIFKQNERRIHFYIHKLGLHDPHREYYVEGIYAMWIAYKKYQPDKGPLSTYFNYTIRNRLIDMLRKKERETHHKEKIVQEEITKIDNGNRDGKSNIPIVETAGITLEDEGLWDELQARLTKNQMKWVYYHIVIGMKLNEIAEQEDVSLNAVKSWGREARKKLKDIGRIE
ncbi:sigma-70 family RNA polymerase sigma factor [Ornithinibacillus sp. L9]|uniref:Sigma-70 family RNA polymerase sigma factor n=1 Tax=Ornithinibacillus caprae TaxID=2678566 RepID=A0A6N8FHG3_9BACI|nr:sigma-70 family RNA polymerase sigma factor [Ornithinibacillus caprae]MUK87497.1 sigma-70 family RNA polymerase sigma factor [Ornithinibacillus caprae]